MTTRYEGAGAKDTAITIHQAGEEIGEDVVPQGEIALAFNYDEVFYLQGTPAEIGTLLTRAQAALKEASGEPPWFTVAGYWGDDDTRIVTSVIEGEHEVSGGDDISEGGPFAVLVQAEDATAAETMVHGSTEEEDFG
jgi:hypothetical protein